MPMHTSARVFSVVTIAQSVLAAPTSRIINANFMRVNKEDSGLGFIAGTVKEKHSPADIPLIRRVRLYKKQDGRLMSEIWSAADGSYLFSQLVMQAYYVVSFDHTGNYNAVIQDSIIPQVMT